MRLSYNGLASACVIDYASKLILLYGKWLAAFETTALGLALMVFSLYLSLTRRPSRRIAPPNTLVGQSFFYLHHVWIHRFQYIAFIFIEAMIHGWVGTGRCHISCGEPMRLPSADNGADLRSRRSGVTETGWSAAKCGHRMRPNHRIKRHGRADDERCFRPRLAYYDCCKQIFRWRERLFMRRWYRYKVISRFTYVSECLATAVS